MLGGLILRTSGAPVPLVWPAFFGAALAVWAQGLTWCPFPLPALRLFVAVPTLGGMVLGAALGQIYNVPEFLLAAVFAALIPAGYFMAVAGLTRARRGDIAERHWPSLRRRTTEATARQPFASVAHALFWLDWQRSYRRAG